MMPDGIASQQISAPPPRQTLMSTSTTSCQSSREAPGRGDKCSGTSSTKSTGFSNPTRKQTPNVKTPFPERIWGKEMGPGPPEKQSSGGTLT